MFGSAEHRLVIVYRAEDKPTVCLFSPISDEKYDIQALWGAFYRATNSFDAISFYALSAFR